MPLVASMSFMGLLRSDCVLHFVFGLLLPIVWTAMLAWLSRLIFGWKAPSKRMDDFALRCQEQGAIGAVVYAIALNHSEANPRQVEDNTERSIGIIQSNAQCQPGDNENLDCVRLRNLRKIEFGLRVL